MVCRLANKAKRRLYAVRFGVDDLHLLAKVSEWQSHNVYFCSSKLDKLDEFIKFI